MFLGLLALCVFPKNPIFLTMCWIHLHNVTLKYFAMTNIFTFSTMFPLWQIEIGLCNVSFVPLYGTDTEKKILALFSPDDYNTGNIVKRDENQSNN